MIQNVIAIVVAGAVCWHNVAGCCTHHDHADRQASAHHHGDADCSQSGTESVGGGSGHCHQVSHRLGGKDARGGEQGWRTCTCQHDSDCRVGSCAFAAPESRTALDWGQDQGDGIFLGFTGHDSTVALSSLRLMRAYAPGEMLSDGAPRRHLVLRVLLL